MEDLPKIRVFTVGDGDLTLSLALARAYGHESLDLVASTLLLSKEELIQTYSNSQQVLQELEERNVPVLFGVDATNLSESCDDNNEWDVILFHHPHLGDSLLNESEEAHADRHHVLLAHYFYSAKSRLREGGIVHVCLCGRQPQTWRAVQAAERQGLVLKEKLSTNIPMDKWLSLHYGEPAPVLPHYPAPRRYRNGKLGSKHFLGRYGYMHRRTHGEQQQGRGDTAMDVNVSGSLHFIFESAHDSGRCVEEKRKQAACQVCGMQFESVEELQQHWKAPALPDPVVCETNVMNHDESNADKRRTSDRVVDKDEIDVGCGESADTISPQNATTARVVDVSDAGFSSTVSREHDGKRLKWYLRHSSFGKQGIQLSKQQAEKMIKGGHVVLNGAIVLDSGRFLRTGDKVHVLKDTSTTDGSVHATGATTTRVEIHHQASDTVVAFKPVGMRTIGSFSVQTLEMTVSLQTGESYKSVSKLDSGCAGLSVLRRTDASPVEKVSHVFTALLHGHVPDRWNGMVLGLSVESMRRWKRGGDRKQADDAFQMDSADTKGTMTRTRRDCVEIKVLERTAKAVNDGTTLLSTVTITTLSAAGGLCNAICYLLRKRGHPVVNDRFCRREYLKLPRSIRNLIKSRLCIGCYTVSWSDNSDEQIKTIFVEAPDRLHAIHWQNHCLVDTRTTTSRDGS